MTDGSGASPPSPCVAICRLDEREICVGCYRTLEEIRRWRDLGASERLAVIAFAADRRDRDRRHD